MFSSSQAHQALFVPLGVPSFHAKNTNLKDPNSPEPHVRLGCEGGFDGTMKVSGRFSTVEVGKIKQFPKRLDDDWGFHDFIFFSTHVRLMTTHVFAAGLTGKDFTPNKQTSFNKNPTSNIEIIGDTQHLMGLQWFCQDLASLFKDIFIWSLHCWVQWVHSRRWLESCNIDSWCLF